MKKLVTIILILLFIFIGMNIYRQNKIKVNKNQEVTIDEINKIETYIQKIYMWKEITGDALPVFDDINNAPDVWLWEVAKKNIEEYELTYEQIQDKLKEIFGENLKKQFPREGYEYMEYDEKTGKYYALGMGLDNQEDMFLLNKIEKNEDGYTVQIIEYLEDYSEAYETENSDYHIQIKNLNEEKIDEVTGNEDESVIQQKVKDNIDKFTQKEIMLKNDEQGNLYVVSVKNI